MSFLQQKFMNSVPGLFYYSDTSTVSSSETPSCITNVFSDFHESDFLAIGYISAKYVPLENISAYWFPYNYFTRLSMFYVAHMHVRLLVCNTLSTLYRLAREIAAERLSLCVVLVIVYISCSIPICYLSLSSSGNTVE